MDFNTKVTKVIRSLERLVKTRMLYSVNQIYFFDIHILSDGVERANGKVVTEWITRRKKDSPLLVAHPGNGLVVIVSSHGTRVEFFKIVVPET